MSIKREFKRGYQVVHTQQSRGDKLRKFFAINYNIGYSDDGPLPKKEIKEDEVAKIISTAMLATGSQPRTVRIYFENLKVAGFVEIVS